MVTVQLTDEQAKLLSEFFDLEHHLVDDGFNRQEADIVNSAMATIQRATKEQIGL